MTVYDPPPRWLVLLVLMLLILLMIEVADAKRWYDVWQELFHG